MKDVRVQLAIGALAFALALFDSVQVGASSINDLSIVGKVATGIVCAVVAWFVIRYLIIGLIFRK
jgi:hypothetical protein